MWGKPHGGHTIESQCDLSLIITVPNDLYARLSFGKWGGSSECGEGKERDECGQHVVLFVWYYILGRAVVKSGELWIRTRNRYRYMPYIPITSWSSILDLALTDRPSHFLGGHFYGCTLSNRFGEGGEAVSPLSSSRYPSIALPRDLGGKYIIIKCTVAEVEEFDVG